MSLAFAPARNVALTADAIALASLGGLVVILAAGTWGTWGDLGRDTGYDVVAGSRIADGEIPYADFTYYYGPLAPGLLALAALAFGNGFGPAMAVGLVVSSAIVGVTYVLARLQVHPFGAFLAAALTAAVAFAPTNLSYVLPHTSSAPLALLGILCFLLALARHAEASRRPWLVGAGASAGIVSLTRPEFALAVVLAGGLWLVARATRLRPLHALDAAALVTPAVAIPAIVYGAFLTVMSPRQLFLENLYPIEELEAAGSAVLRLHAPLTAASFVDLAVALAAYAAGSAGLVLLGLGLARVAWTPRWVVIGAIGGAAVIASLANPEALRTGLQHAYAWIPAGAALALGAALVRMRRRDRRLDATAAVELAAALVLVVLSLKEYAAFYLWSTLAQPAVYAAPLAALLLVRLHLVELARFRMAHTLGAAWLAFLVLAGTGLTIADARAESGVVRGPGGAISARPGEARLYQAALDWIASETRSGEKLLIAPQGTALYVLSGRTSPLSQLSLLPGALPRAVDEQRAIARLQRARIRVVIIDRHVFDEYGHTSFGRSFDRLLAGWIEARFVRVTTLRGGPEARDHVLDVWRRES